MSLLGLLFSSRSNSQNGKGLFWSSYTKPNTTLYMYSSNTTVNGTNLLYGNTNGRDTSAGNYSIGVLNDCESSNNTSIYTYSSNVVTSGTTLGIGGGLSCGIGNSSSGYFIGAWTSSAAILTINKSYNYTSNVVGNSTTMGSIMGACGASLSSYGMIFGGWPNNNGSTNATHKFNFSNASWSSGTNLLTSSGYNSGSNNQTKAVMYLDANASTNIYTFSSNVVTSGTSLPNVYNMNSATGNSNFGIFVKSAGSLVYTYSSNAVSNGAYLAYGGSNQPSSSTPGGF